MSNLIETFYRAFSNLDAETMVSCYHDNIVFADPAFGTLNGDRAKSMWHMLCESQKGKDFKIIFSNVEYDKNTGSAKWEAKYVFSKTGRRVHNKIVANFEFKDGLILKHTDHFNLKQWASQAMGFKGLILGGTSFFKKKLQQQTNRLLDAYQQKNDS